MSTNPDQAHVRILLDVVYDCNGEDPDYLAEHLNSKISGAVYGGKLLTEGNDAIVFKHAMATTLALPAEDAVSAADVEQWISKQIQSGQLTLADMPRLIARLALADPWAVRAEIAANAGPHVAASHTVVYALCSTIERGLRGRFEAGPYSKFDPAWISEDMCVFIVTDVTNPEIAFEDMTRYAGNMSSEIYAELHRYGDTFPHTMTAADCDSYDKLNQLIDASPFGENELNRPETVEIRADNNERQTFSWPSRPRQR